MSDERYDCCWLHHSSYCPECYGEICKARLEMGQEAQMSEQRKHKKVKPEAVLLKPCPFCGGKAEMKATDNDSYIIECQHEENCLLQHSGSLERTNSQELAEFWNARKRC